MAGGISTILKQAKEAGCSVPARQIVKAVYAGCREILDAGRIGDPDSKIDALFRAMDKLKQMDVENYVIDDQILDESEGGLHEPARRTGKKIGGRHRG